MSGQELPQPLAQLVRARYAEPHRRYHDSRHLDAVLRHVEDLAAEAADPTAVRLAAWFHDAVYEPARDDNEAASAELARVLLGGAGFAPGLVTEVGRLVLLTAGHRPEPGDRNGAVLCDADLAILGADPGDYDAYAREVRQEYAHVPAPAFAVGRAAVLRGLLEQRPLFRTTTGAARWESAAPANLPTRDSRLSAPPPDPPP